MLLKAFKHLLSADKMGYPIDRKRTRKSQTVTPFFLTQRATLSLDMGPIVIIARFHYNHPPLGRRIKTLITPAVMCRSETTECISHRRFSFSYKDDVSVRQEPRTLELLEEAPPNLLGMILL